MNDKNYNIEDLKMRKAVGIILIRDDGFVWTGKRKISPGVRDGEKNLWQMPQGGIDEGERPIEAAFRELEEETGTRSAVVLFEFENWLEYRLPNELIGKVLKGFKGQEQKWFLMRFLGEDSDVNIDTDEPEFSAWKWIAPADLPEAIVSFKRDVYRSVLAAFKEYLP